MRRLDRVLDELEHFGLKLGLDRMKELLRALGSPEADLRVALVAGTNGKGSTAAWLAAMVTAAGYHSGLFTSPHLERPEERLRVDGRSISAERLLEVLDEILEAARKGGVESITYFEALTAAAICHFRNERVDLAVIEVGLGGRLDATNLCDPMLSLVTEISFDHQRLLGDSLAEIAQEKAGIFRPRRHALSSVVEEESRTSLELAARQLGTPLRFVGDDTQVMERDELRAEGQRLTLQTPAARYRLRSRLGGAHQIGNLALAIAAAEVLGASALPRLDGAAIEAGTASCVWPGRLEWIELGDAAAVILDGAHNPSGIEALIAYLDELGEPFDLLFGMLREKIEPAVTSRLWRRASRVTVTQPPSDRALSTQDLIAAVGIQADEAIEKPQDALDRALSGSRLLVVSGSIYLLGEVRKHLRTRFGVPLPTDRIFGG